MVSALINVSLVNIWVSHKVVLKILRGNESSTAEGRLAYTGVIHGSISIGRLHTCKEGLSKK